MEINLKNSQRAKSLDLKRIKKDLSTALHLLGLDTAELSVLFVNDNRMKCLNARYRGIDKATDVLSFPMAGDDFSSEPFLLGDIVISVSMALTQSNDYRVPFYDELRRLMIHGLLHLAGFDHEGNASRKREMEKKEGELLNALKTMD
jgi:probable rRNA maturation factor